MQIRAAECSRVLDALERLDRGEAGGNELPSALPPKAFEGKVDASRALLAGHSFGGAAALLGLARDPRFAAGVALDPWMFPLKEEVGRLAGRVRRPVLFVLAESFQTDANFRALLPFRREGNAFVTLK